MSPERFLSKDKTLKSSTLVYETSNAPESSQYNIQLSFPDRPKTSHLSGLTLRENEKNQIFESGRIHKTSLRSTGLSQSQGVMKMPTDQDFTRILTKLEMICANRTSGNRRIILNDSNSIEILLESGDIQYFTINSKGKTPPLTCTIKRSKGKTISYLSKIHTEPSKTMSEVKSKHDVFQISDVSLKFKNEAIFLSIEALSESILTLSVKFGDKTDIKKSKNLKTTKEEQETINKLDSEFSILYPSRSKSERKFLTKDFVKINIETLKRKLSVRDLVNKRQDWQIRRDSVLIRKRMHMVEKKERTLNIINKRMIRLEEEKKEREKHEELMVLQEKQSKWISLINFALSIKEIGRIREFNRQKVFNKVKKSIAAYKLQKMYRIKVGHSIDSVLILRTLTVLRFYLFNVKKFFMKTQVKAIKQSARNHILPHRFRSYIEKIVFIQRIWTDYAHKKKVKWEILVNMWNSALEEQMLNYARQLTKKKRRSHVMKKYSGISIASRNIILEEHILERKKNYLKVVKEIKARNFRNIDKAIQEMNTIVVKGERIRIRSFPVFTIIPTKGEMVKLVEKALKASIGK
ncbi:hypothetical protein SteCoe_19848 [Stentor coeruleus]|uniref:Uncharacterized protein n=1 Tax=Stentor coeruleus TaxID=5963 RepID=A0A1R2BT32_9CILI|nr:hypothetical protein SteCoe_19848 [Stentor coeruleus]